MLLMWRIWWIRGEREAGKEEYAEASEDRVDAIEPERRVVESGGLEVLVDEYVTAI